jgi:hypothetical protein
VAVAWLGGGVMCRGRAEAAVLPSGCVHP